METIFETDYAQIKFSDKGAYVLTRWLGKKNVSLEEFKEVFETTLNYQANNPGKVRFFISDMREQGIVPPEYRKWIQEVVLPRTVEYKLEQIAAIFSGNVFQKYYLNNILNSTKRFGVNIKFFSKEEDAISWVENL